MKGEELTRVIPGKPRVAHQSVTPLSIAALTQEKRASDTYHLTLVLVESLVSSIRLPAEGIATPFDKLRARNDRVIVDYFLTFAVSF